MSFNSQQLYGIGVGATSTASLEPILMNRAPTTTDVRYVIGQRWVYVGTGEYVLTSITTTGGVASATWSLLGTATGALNTLTGDSGGAISPSAGNITLSGTGSQITTTGSGSTITFSLVGPYTPSTFTAHGVLIGEGSSSVVATTPGTTGQVLIASTGADPAFGALGVNSGLTAHGVLLGEGNSAIAATAVGTNGQVLIGATGADPAFATITSSGSTLTLTGGANTLNIDVTAPLAVTNGGTGATSLTGVLTGNGSSAITANAVTNHGVLVAGASNAVSSLTVGTNGQVLVGSTGASPAFSTLTTSTGIKYTTGAHTLAVDVTGGGMAANAESGAGPFVGATQNSYIFSEAAQTTVSLPATSAVGDFFLVCGTNANSGGWVVSQAAGQQIFNGTNHSTSGATGTISTAAANTSGLLVCTAANTTWIAIATVGTVTYT